MRHGLPQGGVHVLTPPPPLPAPPLPPTPSLQPHLPPAPSAIGQSGICVVPTRGSRGPYGRAARGLSTAHRCRRHPAATIRPDSGVQVTQCCLLRPKCCPAARVRPRGCGCLLSPLHNFWPARHMPHAAPGATLPLAFLQWFDRPTNQTCHVQLQLHRSTRALLSCLQSSSAKPPSVTLILPLVGTWLADIIFICLAYSSSFIMISSTSTFFCFNRGFHLYTFTWSFSILCVGCAAGTQYSGPARPSSSLLCAQGCSMLFATKSNPDVIICRGDAVL